MTALGRPQPPADTPQRDIRELNKVSAALTPTTGAVPLDFSLVNGKNLTHALTGDVTYSTAHGADGAHVVVYIAGGTGFNLAFPAGWVFVGAKPTAIAAGKTGRLVVEFVGGSTDAKVVANYAVQT